MSSGRFIKSNEDQNPKKSAKTDLIEKYKDNIEIKDAMDQLKKDNLSTNDKKQIKTAMLIHARCLNEFDERTTNDCFNTWSNLFSIIKIANNEKPSRARMASSTVEYLDKLTTEGELPTLQDANNKKEELINQTVDGELSTKQFSKKTHAIEQAENRLYECLFASLLRGKTIGSSECEQEESNLRHIIRNI